MLFIVSLPVFDLYLRPEKFAEQALWMSLLVSLPPFLYLWFRAGVQAKNEVKLHGFYTNLSPLISLALGLVVVLALSMVDITDLRITRSVSRDEGALIRLINLHLVLFLFVCIYHFSRVSRGLSGRRGLLAVSFALSLFIALAEGRRTAILIPVLLLGLFSATTSTTAWQTFRRGVVYVISFFGLFMIVTLFRSDYIFQVEVLFRSVLTRLFNPGHMMLEVMSIYDFNFDPQTLENVVERIGYIAGLSDYQGNTNQFGVYYGFISSSNRSVGINPGVILENYLSFGVFYLIPLFALVEASLYVMNIYKRIFFKSDYFVAVLILHGMQMEMPYTVGLLIKLGVVGLLALLASYVLPKVRKHADLSVRV